MYKNVLYLVLASCALLFSFNGYAQLPPIEIRSNPTATDQGTSVNGLASETSDSNAVLEWNVLGSSFGRRDVSQSVYYNDVFSFSFDAGLQGDEAPFLLAQSTETDATSESDTEASGDEAADLAQLSEALANPLSYLWLMFAQSDTTSYEGDLLDDIGEDDIVNTSVLIQPVISMQLTENWKTIIRPVIPINSFKTVDNVNITTGTVDDPFGVELDRETGMGDIVLWAALSNQYKPPNIFGFGLTAMFDTASEDQLGTGKNSIGPMVMAMRITDNWIYGAVAQHWESYSGSDSYNVNSDIGKIKIDREDVSLTDVQPVIRYRLNLKTNIGMAPNWRYNHETNQASIPVGIGFDTLVKMGKLPVKVGAEIYHYVEKDDDFGPDWQIRLLFVPVLPSPDWSRTPLF